MKVVASPRPGDDSSAAPNRGILERARRRRADRDDAAALGAGAVDRVGGGLGDLVALRIDHVLPRPVGAHRLERAVADVQRDLGALDAARARARRASPA